MSVKKCIIIEIALFAVLVIGLNFCHLGLFWEGMLTIFILTIASHEFLQTAIAKFFGNKDNDKKK